MIIDFHTHIFPDAIAARTIEMLKSFSNNSVAYTDGTLAGLKVSLARYGIDYALVLPVATAPHQFDSVNRFARLVNQDDRLFSFGGIHPANDHLEERLRSLRDEGFRGIKLHPDYQKVFIDDPRNVKILEICLSLGLYVTIHAGVDVGFPDVVHCPPRKMRSVLRSLYGTAKDPDPKIILAHMGGWELWDDVQALLCGENVLLDLSYTLGKAEDQQVLDIIRCHGADRVLFASDSPWSNPREDADRLNALPLSQAEKDKIFYQNACSILQIPCLR